MIRLLLLLIGGALLFMGCRRESAVSFIAETYSCCEPGCQSGDFLSAVEEFAADGRLVRGTYYDVDFPGKVNRVSLRTYRAGRLVNVIDSAEFYFDRTELIYEDNRLVKSVKYGRHSTVYNEVIDTVPHTEWGLAYDTLTTWFGYENGRLSRIVTVSQDDTISIVSRMHDDRGRLKEVFDGSTRRRYHYNETDSLDRIDLLSYAPSGSRTADTTLSWSLYGTIQIEYDSLHRRKAERTFDDLDILMTEFLYGYDAKARLVSRHWGSGCESLVYRAP
jgi:hypothetical protein